MRINSEVEEFSPERVALIVEKTGLGFAEAEQIAKSTARQRAPNAMLLSWNDRKRGEFYPQFECGNRQRPSWKVFAESRGGNLTVDINDGDYTFIFLLMS